MVSVAEIEIMLIFVIASNKKVDPPNFAQTHSCICCFYPLLHPHNLLKETSVNH